MDIAWELKYVIFSAQSLGKSYFVWGPPAQEGCGVDPKEGYGDGLRADPSHLWRKVEGAELVQLGEQNVLGRSHCSLPVTLERAYKLTGGGPSFYSLIASGQGGMASNLN